MIAIHPSIIEKKDSTLIDVNKIEFNSSSLVNEIRNRVIPFIEKEAFSVENEIILMKIRKEQQTHISISITSINDIKISNLVGYFEVTNYNVLVYYESGLTKNEFDKLISYRTQGMKRFVNINNEITVIRHAPIWTYSISETSKIKLLDVKLDW